MHQTSESFNESILQNGRTFSTKIVVDDTELSGIISAKLTSRSCSSNCFTVGGAVSASVDIEIWKSAVQLKNKEFDLYFGLAIGEETEWVPMGKFTATDTQDDDGILKFTAYDRIWAKMGGTYIFSELTYPADGKTVLQEISEKTGVPIRIDDLPDGIMIPQRELSTETVIDEDGNETVSTTYSAPFDGYSCREALGYLAQFYGRFAVANRTGTVELRWYKQTSYELKADRYYDDLAKEEQKFSVGTVTCNVGSSVLSTGSGADYVHLENPVMTQERLQAIYQQIAELEFLPSRLSFYGDPRIDLGDVVNLYDKSGNLIQVPLMYVMHDFDGGLLTRIQSYGGTESEASQAKGPLAQALDRVYTDLSLIKELIADKASINYLIANYLKASEADIRYAKMGKIEGENGWIDLAKGIFNYGDNLIWDGEKLIVLGTLYGEEGVIGGWHIADNCLYVDSPNGDSRIVLQNVGWKILQTTEYSAFTKDENGTRTNCAVIRGTNGYTIIPQADGQLTFFSEFPADPGRYSIVIVSTHDGVPHLSARSTDPEIEGPDWGFEDPSIVVDLEKSHKIWDYYDIVLDGDEAIGPFMFWANIKSVTAGEVIELRVTITKDGETYESGDGDNVSSGVPNNYVLSRKIEEAGKITFPFHIDYDGLIYTEKDIYEHGEKLSERYMLKSEKPKIEGVTLEGDKTFEELNLQGISNSELEEILKL